MSFPSRLLESSRRLDHAVYTKTGLNRLVSGFRSTLPPGLRKISARYGPILSLILVIVLYALAFSAGDPARIQTGNTDLNGPEPGEAGGATAEALAAEQAAAQAAAAAQAGKPGASKVFPGQKAIPPTANVCGINGVLKTGPNIQFPYAVQCLPTPTGDNGGATSRGVTRDAIHIAVYVTRDPTVLGPLATIGGCGTDACITNHVQAYVDWFEKYYLTYGRKVNVRIHNATAAREADAQGAIADAKAIASFEPKVFAVLGGPGEAGAVYARELKANGIMCICTVSLPQEFYEETSPYVWSQLMSSTQAYIHRAEYIGKRLANRKAKHAGAPEPTQQDLRQRNREFGFVWFNNAGSYKSGIDFFKAELNNKYNVTLKKDVEYEGIQGCQLNASNIVAQLISADVTSVIFSGDPFCPEHLTNQAEAQRLKWEWIITGSVLSDTNDLARTYNANQWARAFGVSMLSPEIKDENEYHYKMFQEVRPGTTPARAAPLFLPGPHILATGIHLAGAKLNPTTFKAGMEKLNKVGGTVSLPLRSFGPKNLGGLSLWDSNHNDDMTELFWDNTAQDSNGVVRSYRWVAGGKRYPWYGWPDSEPNVFNDTDAPTGYDKAPDQP